MSGVVETAAARFEVLCVARSSVMGQGEYYRDDTIAKSVLHAGTREGGADGHCPGFS